MEVEFYCEYLKKPSGILKLVEIVTVVIAFGILRGADTLFTISMSADATFFGVGVLVTAMIITPLLLACYLMGKLEIQKTIFEIVFNSLMFVFLLSAGSVAINTWDKQYTKVSNKRDASLAMGSFCLLASFAYLADTVFAVLNFRK
ncbi:protein snakeskin-like [Homarus americanus]|uniref:Snakeskin-like n=1 Tax=Homarus americanus TaxID=6706 RepID=A0A8J5NAJ4_HOMAM|nr:protein snakeskin-like [Homarus americanus]KAG7176126.1 snakeskin-like [Homarus americanus]